MRIQPLILLAGLAACSASPTAGESATPTKRAAIPLTPYEAEWETYRETSALPAAVPAEGASFQRTLSDKLEALKAQEALYAELRSSDDLAAQSQAHFGSARLYLNLGCELATFAAPEGLSPAQATMWSEQIRRVAGPMITKAQTGFSTAANMAGGLASDRAAEVVAALSDDVVASCGKTAATWAASSRPELAPIDPDACLDQARNAGTSRACVSVVAAACQAGEGDMCEPAGDYAYEHDSPDQALEFWSIGCDKHRDKRACGARTLTARPQFVTEYAAQCESGDVFGCLRLARVAEQQSGPVAPTACTASGAISPSTGTPARCEAGDAASCWALVAKQLAIAPMPAVDGVGGLLGALVGSKANGEAVEEFKRGCAAGRAFDCMNVASATEGEDALPWLEKACAAGVGCGELGGELIEFDVDVPRGAELLVADCVERGRSGSCSRAAELFMAGKNLPKSAPCAAALSLRTCTPIEPWDCTNVNQLFHPKK